MQPSRFAFGCLARASISSIVREPLASLKADHVLLMSHLSLLGHLHAYIAFAASMPCNQGGGGGGGGGRTRFFCLVSNDHVHWF